MAAPVVIFEGHEFLRQRLILSVLSGKSIRVKKIRSTDDNPGLRDYEVSLIKLLDKVTNGTFTHISETGTQLLFQPGVLTGGPIEHDCDLGRAIGYYLEALIMLAPFMKKALKVVLRGITNDHRDPSVDMIKVSAIPLLKRFLVTDEGYEFKITRRGVRPEGGGEVVVALPSRQKLRPLQFLDPGKIKRVRGTAWAVRVSPAFANRIVDAARSILNQFITDIYIYTDHLKGSQAGKSPGFGLTLVAETTTGAFLTTDICSNPRGSGLEPSIPEDIGKLGANMLMEEIYSGGCVDRVSQSLACVLMTLTPKDVNKIQTGHLTPYTVEFLRNIHEFFKTMFKVDPVKPSDADSELKLGGEKLTLTCVGIGYSNVSKAVL